MRLRPALSVLIPAGIALACGSKPDEPLSVTGLEPRVIEVFADETVTLRVEFRDADGELTDPVEATWGGAATEGTGSGDTNTIAYTHDEPGVYEIAFTPRTDNRQAIRMFVQRCEACNPETLGDVTVRSLTPVRQLTAWNDLHLGLGEARPLHVDAVGWVDPTRPIRPVHLGGQVRYISADPTVATIDANGLVTANALGTTQIHATAGNQALDIDVVVTATPLTGPPLGFTSWPLPRPDDCQEARADECPAIHATIALDPLGWPVVLTQPDPADTPDPDRYAIGAPPAILARWTGTGWGTLAVGEPRQQVVGAQLALDREGFAYVAYQGAGGQTGRVVAAVLSPSGGAVYHDLPSTWSLEHPESEPPIDDVFAQNIAKNVLPAIAPQPQGGAWVAYAFHAAGHPAMACGEQNCGCQVGLRLASVRADHIDVQDIRLWDGAPNAQCNDFPYQGLAFDTRIQQILLDPDPEGGPPDVVLIDAESLVATRWQRVGDAWVDDAPFPIAPYDQNPYEYGPARATTLVAGDPQARRGWAWRTTEGDGYQLYDDEMSPGAAGLIPYGFDRGYDHAVFGSVYSGDSGGWGAQRTSGGRVWWDDFSYLFDADDTQPFHTLGLATDDETVFWLFNDNLQQPWFGAFVPAVAPTPDDPLAAGRLIAPSTAAWEPVGTPFSDGGLRLVTFREDDPNLRTGVWHGPFGGLVDYRASTHLMRSVDGNAFEEVGGVEINTSRLPWFAAIDGAIYGLRRHHVTGAISILRSTDRAATFDVIGEFSPGGMPISAAYRGRALFLLTDGTTGPELWHLPNVGAPAGAQRVFAAGSDIDAGLAARSDGVGLVTFDSATAHTWRAYTDDGALFDETTATWPASHTPLSYTTLDDRGALLLIGYATDESELRLYRIASDATSYTALGAIVADPMGLPTAPVRSPDGTLQVAAPVSVDPAGKGVARFVSRDGGTTFDAGTLVRPAGGRSQQVLAVVPDEDDYAAVLGDAVTSYGLTWHDGLSSAPLMTVWMTLPPP